ncbi:MAG TPA: hypothetical protein VGG39_25335 [Polyangiaceae bacterium]|jgi:hypothetical protein
MRASLRALALAGAVVGSVVAVAPGARASEREACFSAAEVAQKVRAQGHLLDAREKLRVCAHPACPQAVRDDCTTWLAEVEAELPSIVVHARDAAGNDVADVEVLVDGAKVADRLDGLPVAVDPGAHTLQMERAGDPPVERSLVVVAGQKARVVEVQWGAAPPPGSTPSAPAPPEATGPQKPSWLARVPTSALVAGGVGAAALLGTIVLWAWGRADYGSLQSSCSPRCSPSSVDGVRTKLVAGDVFLGVGVVSLGVATWLALRHGSASAQTSLQPNASLVVGAEPAGGTLGVAGYF